MKALPQRNIEMNEYNSPLEMKSIFISETPYLFLFSPSGKGEKCIGKRGSRYASSVFFESQR